MRYKIKREGEEMDEIKKIVIGIRNEMGLTQAELARLSGVGEKFIRRIEKGEIPDRTERVNQVIFYLSRLWFEHCKSFNSQKTEEKSILSYIKNILVRRKNNERL